MRYEDVLYTIHELKCIEPHFSDVENGNKKFEIRLKDRNFAVGDVLILRQYFLESNKYSGKKVRCRVTHILDNEDFCKEGYCIMSIEVE